MTISTAPLADILNLGSNLFHLLGHTALLRQHAWAALAPPRWLPDTDGHVLEAVLDVVGDIAGLLHPSLDKLVLVALVMRGHEESLHHMELIPDEGMVALDTNLHHMKLL
uniref:Uncharacterized protein n=1 Tax=Oryza punctata TaxID=4537 RepID=A0A0E0LXF9_ORYPU